MCDVILIIEHDKILNRALCIFILVMNCYTYHISFNRSLRFDFLSSILAISKGLLAPGIINELLEVPNNWDELMKFMCILMKRLNQKVLVIMFI